jgi:hypothetical protein
MGPLSELGFDVVRLGCNIGFKELLSIGNLSGTGRLLAVFTLTKFFWAKMLAMLTVAMLALCHVTHGSQFKSRNCHWCEDFRGKLRQCKRTSGRNYVSFV